MIVKRGGLWSFVLRAVRRAAAAASLGPARVPASGGRYDCFSFHLDFTTRELWGSEEIGGTFKLRRLYSASDLAAKLSGLHFFSSDTRNNNNSTYCFFLTHIYALFLFTCFIATYLIILPLFASLRSTSFCYRNCCALRGFVSYPTHSCFLFLQPKICFNYT